MSLAVRSCPELEWNLDVVRAFWWVSRPSPFTSIFEIHFVDDLVRGINAIHRQAYHLIWDGFYRWICFVRRARRRRVLIDEDDL